ncbi:thymidine kinase [Candidatus Dependentiae bacterium Noda2021]|nr:thymidine kinase [Candidatus Dependentiae bacterium Noda2021]
MKKTNNKGYLEVICGPMFSGKSEELIRRLRRAQIAQQHVLCVKHVLDDRWSVEHIVSHNGSMFKTRPLTNIQDILTLVESSQADVVGIDEAQFFSENLLTIVQALIKLRKRVIIAGLDLDFRGVPFGAMPTLMAISDTVTKLTAICTLCGDEAALSQRLINGSPARHDQAVVLIGAQEAYQARCRGCYQIGS